MPTEKHQFIVVANVVGLVVVARYNILLGAGTGPISLSI